MDFFQQLHRAAQGLDISIRLKEKNGKYTMSLLPEVANKANIKPLILSGTPEELDHNFLESIINPFSEAAGIVANAKQFTESVKQEVEKQASKKSASSVTKKSDSANSKKSAKKAAKKADKPAKKTAAAKTKPKKPTAAEPVATAQEQSLFDTPAQDNSAPAPDPAPVDDNETNSLTENQSEDGTRSNQPEESIQNEEGREDN